MFKIIYNKGNIDIFVKNLGDAKDRLTKEYKASLAATMLDIQTTSKRPGYVPYKTGTLKRSITHDITERADKLIGTVGSNLVYARIQEYGGTILPKKGKYLRFMVNGSWVAVKQVTIKPKLYLTRAIKDNVPGLRKRLKALEIIKRK